MKDKIKEIKGILNDIIRMLEDCETREVFGHNHTLFTWADEEEIKKIKKRIDGI